MMLMDDDVDVDIELAPHVWSKKKSLKFLLHPPPWDDSLEKSRQLYRPIAWRLHPPRCRKKQLRNRPWGVRVCCLSCVISCVIRRTHIQQYARSEYHPPTQVANMMTSANVTL